MTFLLLPLLLLASSLLVIFLIVSRKFVYLKKLTPEVLEEASGDQADLLGSFFAEIGSSLKGLRLREHGVSFLAELEKSLRKLRLLSLRIESSTGNLISHIRHRVQAEEERLNQEALLKSEQSQQQVQLDPVNDQVVAVNDLQYIREEEQRLIMSIAKSPRDAELYKALGSIYVQTNELEDARQSFEKALELNPTDYMVKTKLARVLHKLKYVK